MFTIKNCKIIQSMSEETYCFTATLYYEGKKVAHASNRGCGGPTDFDWVSPEAKAKCLAVASATKPEYPYPQFLLEGIVDELVGEHDVRDELKRAMRTKTLFRKPDEVYPEGEYSTVLSKFNPQVKNYLVGKYGPNVFILNEKGV